MNGEQRSMHTKVDATTSSSSSYYELDINYSPEQEKLFLQLQAVTNKESFSGAISNHVTMDHEVHRHAEKPEEVVERTITEDIKERFMEEIMPFYIDHLASRKKRKRAAATPEKKKDKPCPHPSRCFCSLNYKVPSRIGTNNKQAAVLIKVDDQKQEVVVHDDDGQKVISVIEPVTCGSKSPTTDSCPPTPDTTESVIKRSIKQNKSGVPKEKGKLTAKKAPLMGDKYSTSSSSNNAGDGTPLSSSLDEKSNEAIEKVRARTIKLKHLRKHKPETATVSTQVKPKHLKVINLKIQQRDETLTTNKVLADDGNKANDDLYYVLLSQTGFDRSKSKRFPVNTPMQEQQPKEVSVVDDATNSNKVTDKEIQTKKADASVSIQTSLAAIPICKVSTVQVQYTPKRSRKKLMGDCDDASPKQRGRKHKRRGKTGTYCNAETSTLKEIPVKEKVQKAHTLDCEMGPTKLPFPPPSCGPNIFFPPTFAQYPYRNLQNITTGRGTKNTTKPIISNIYEPPSFRATTSTNTDDHNFFLERRICPFTNQKARASVQIKDTGLATSCNRPNEALLRTEISFSDLNLKPVLSYYMNQLGGMANCKPADLVRFYASARAQGANKLRHRPRNSSLVHRVVETSKKQGDEVTKTGAFEVGGIEPPKKIGFGVSQVGKGKLCTSHFAVIEIKPDDDQINVVTTKALDAWLAHDSLDDLRGRVVELEDKVVTEEVAPAPEPVAAPAPAPALKEAVVVKKGRPRKHRPFVRATWRTRLFQLSGGSTLKKKPAADAVEVKPAGPKVVEDAATSNDFGGITEESPSRLSTVSDVTKEVIATESPSSHRENIVKKMIEADHHLEETIDKVLKMDVLAMKEASNQSDFAKVKKVSVCSVQSDFTRVEKVNVCSVQSDFTKVEKVSVCSGGCGTNKLPPIPSKIEEEVIEAATNTRKSTKVSLLSEVGAQASTIPTTNTPSVQSRPSFSSGESNNVVKPRKKKKFKPMLPVKIRSPNTYSTLTNLDEQNFTMKPKKGQERGGTGGIAMATSTTAKSVGGKSQKCSECTVATRVGTASLKSTQLFVSCAHKSSTSSKKALGSSFLFTKEFRNSKTKLSAFQKRKLYGEYIRKADAPNRSIHSICEIIVSEEEKEKLNYAKKCLPKEYNQEMQVVVKESPMHRFVFHNNKSRNSGDVPPKRPVNPVRKISRPVSPTKPAPVRRLVTTTRSKGKIPRINETARKNCFVLMEMFNNKNFETDSSCSIPDKESIYEIYVGQPDDNPPASSKSTNTIPTDVSDNNVSEEAEDTHIDVLSQHERLLVDHADEVLTKFVAKSCEDTIVPGDKKVNVNERKSAKSCSAAANGDVSSLERLCWFSLPKSCEQPVIEKFSTDSLEGRYSASPTGKTFKKSSGLIPRRNVTIVAYNTEIKYDKDLKNDTKTEGNNSSATFAESGYESNKSKNTLKRFFRRKFNIFKSSKIEIATRYVQQQSATEPEQGSSSTAAYLYDDWSSKETKASLSKSVSTKKSNDACPSSTTDDHNERSATTNQQATNSLTPATVTINAAAATKKMVTWADLYRQHPITKGLLEFCYANKSITVSPQLLQLTYRADVPNKPPDKTCVKSCVVEVATMPQKVMITVSTETSHRRPKTKTTQCDLRPQNEPQENVIAYMENRFQELERKIENAVSAARTLQDNCCMCSEDEFQVRETVPQTNISIGSNTEGRDQEPRASIGTESSHTFAEKEVNTEKKKTHAKRKQGKCSKGSFVSQTMGTQWDNCRCASQPVCAKRDSTSIASQTISPDRDSTSTASQTESPERDSASFASENVVSKRDSTSIASQTERDSTSFASENVVSKRDSTSIASQTERDSASFASENVVSKKDSTSIASQTIDLERDSASFVSESIGSKRGIASQSIGSKRDSTSLASSTIDAERGNVSLASKTMSDADAALENEKGTTTKPIKHCCCSIEGRGEVRKCICACVMNTTWDSEKLIQESEQEIGVADYDNASLGSTHSIPIEGKGEKDGDRGDVKKTRCFKSCREKKGHVEEPQPSTSFQSQQENVEAATEIDANSAQYQRLLSIESGKDLTPDSTKTKADSKRQQRVSINTVDDPTEEEIDEARNTEKRGSIKSKVDAKSQKRVSIVAKRKSLEPQENADPVSIASGADPEDQKRTSVKSMEDKQHKWYLTPISSDELRALVSDSPGRKAPKTKKRSTESERSAEERASLKNVGVGGNLNDQKRASIRSKESASEQRRFSLKTLDKLKALRRESLDEETTADLKQSSTDSASLSNADVDENRGSIQRRDDGKRFSKTSGRSKSFDYDAPTRHRKQSSTESEGAEERVSVQESLEDEQRHSIKGKEDAKGHGRFSKTLEKIKGPWGAKGRKQSGTASKGVQEVPVIKIDDVLSAEGEEEGNKFQKVLTKKDSLVLLVDQQQKRKQSTVPEEDEDDDELPSEMRKSWDGMKKSRRSISFATNKHKRLLGTSSGENQTEDKEKKSSDDILLQYTDQELFDKLLESYERENDIVERLSKDDEFFEAQLSAVRSKQSIEKIIADTNQEKQKKPKLLSKFFKRKSSLTEIVAMRDAAAITSENEMDIITTADEGIADHEINEDDITPMDGKDLASSKVQFSGSSLLPIEKKFVSSEDSDEQDLPPPAARSGFSSPCSKVDAKEIGKCFRRGFRPDNIVLTGEPCLKVSEKEQKRRISGDNTVAYIDFSERDTPLEFLLGLGFSVDEASNAIKDEDVKNRLNAAITEARVWINKINTTQGTMLYLVAFKTRPKTMRYFLQLVEAIINQRVVDAVKLDGFLKLLERIEEGNVNMITILGMDRIDDEQNEENMVKKQLRKLFYEVYKIAESEAAARRKPLTREAIVLLRILAAKYRAGLQPHLELIARYIGQGLLINEVQLEAAMIYLARIDTAEVNLRDFEEYCGIRCTKEKQLEEEKMEAKRKKKQHTRD